MNTRRSRPRRRGQPRSPIETRAPSAARAFAQALLLATPLALAASCNLTAGSRGLEATGPFLERPPASEARAVPEFTSLYVDGPLDVEVRVGSPSSVQLTGDEGRLVELGAEVRESTLILRADPGPVWRVGPRALVTMPDLAAVTSAGSGWIAVTGLDAARIEVRLRGSGDVLLRGRVGELAADDSGAGRIDVNALVVGPISTR